MKLVVTGGTGRIGEFVVRELLHPSDGSAGHQVNVVSRSGGTMQPGVQSILADLQDLGQTVGALAGADVVIQLAAITRKRGVAVNEVIFRGSVLADLNVHEAAWRLGIRRVISTSSVSALGWDFMDHPFLPDYLPIDEDHPFRPQDAYGLAKEVGESIARSYTAKSGMVTVAIRPPAVLLPEQMEQLGKQGGAPTPALNTFSYVDVRDLAVAYRLAAERPLTGHQALYVVADDSRVAEPLSDLLPRLYPPVSEMAQALTGTQNAVSNARARHVLGWAPTRTWRQADAS
jgi:nucleoside-diphosphate-sugar epimerase